MSLIPLVAWLARDWVLLTIISILPLGLLFLAWKLVPESPRYLLTRGRVREAEAVLSNMSRVNGNAEPKDLFQRLSSASKSMRAQKVKIKGQIQQGLCHANSTVSCSLEGLRVSESVQ